MCEYKSLSELNVGDEVHIASLDATGSIRRRLLDLGFVEGTRVTCELKRPRGESAAFRVRDTLIALRKEDSRTITAI